MSDYATKTDLKKAIGVGTSKSDIASLKPEADELDIEKLETVPVDMSKLSSVVNNEFVKKKRNCIIKLDLEKKINVTDKRHF